MLSAAYFRDMAKRRAWVLVPAFMMGVIAMLVYFALVGYWRVAVMDLAREHVGERAAELLPVVLVLPAFGLFLLPVVWGEHKAKRFAVICPNCSKDLTRSVRRITATRCCHSCGAQTVEGRTIRSRESFERLSRIEQRRFLRYWFWAWPMLGLLVVGYHWIEPSAIENCPHMLFIPGLIGVATIGWAFARTRDRRFLPHFAASAFVLYLGLKALW